MAYTDLQRWLWLTFAFGPTNPRKWNVLSCYDGIGRTVDELLSGNHTALLPQDKRQVRAANMDRVDRLIEFCGKNGIRIAHYNSPDYPARLYDIYNPPSVLFYKGDLSGIDNNIVITAVGTKKPSDYSVEVSHKICYELAKSGVHIASGFAVGLDSVAHTAALKAGSKTYAVLPCGLLCSYPAANEKSKAIIAEHGAVISEYFPNDKVTSLYFRARNRVLSGIGLGTLVLQAGSRSGALSTASFALTQGRDIFCIPPHELFNDSYAGAVGLIRDGATPVFDADDILNAYKNVYWHNDDSGAETGDGLPATDVCKGKSEPIVHGLPGVSENPRKETVGPKEELFKSKPIKEHAVEESEHEKMSNEEPDPRESYLAVMPSPDKLSGIKRRIYDFIRENGEIHLDQLSIGIGDVYELEAYLTELELEGLVRSLPGNRFSV